MNISQHRWCDGAIEVLVEWEDFSRTWHSLNRVAKKHSETCITYAHDNNLPMLHPALTVLAVEIAKFLQPCEVNVFRQVDTEIMTIIKPTLDHELCKICVQRGRTPKLTFKNVEWPANCCHEDCKCGGNRMCDRCTKTCDECKKDFCSHSYKDGFLINYCGKYTMVDDEVSIICNRLVCTGCNASKCHKCREYFCNNHGGKCQSCNTTPFCSKCHPSLCTNCSKCLCNDEHSQQCAGAFKCKKQFCSECVDSLQDQDRVEVLTYSNQLFCLDEKCQEDKIDLVHDFLDASYDRDNGLFFSDVEEETIDYLIEMSGWVYPRCESCALCQNYLHWDDEGEKQCMGVCGSKYCSDCAEYMKKNGNIMNVFQGKEVCCSSEKCIAAMRVKAEELFQKKRSAHGPDEDHGSSKRARSML